MNRCGSAAYSPSPVAILGLGRFAAHHAYWHYAADFPGIERLAHYQSPATILLDPADGGLLTEYAVEKRVFIPVSAMTRLLGDAFLAVEDRHFRRHGGINVPASFRAGIIDLMNCNSGRRLINASTIAQQVPRKFSNRASSDCRQTVNSLKELSRWEPTYPLRPLKRPRRNEAAGRIGRLY